MAAGGQRARQVHELAVAAGAVLRPADDDDDAGGRGRRAGGRAVQHAEQRLAFAGEGESLRRAGRRRGRRGQVL
ncbi:hypothetical protein [Rubrivivax benzoatilyticus]|uniref:hypothetical protein n=1 Tax=Rubrivivax benzoatilyticus TaxID=316997 RepID=UPI00192AAC23|nr:hypothetical protein [Rubrivivax benzoatilyticus]